MAVAEMIDDETLDVTDRIENYEKGKAWKCDCGQGIGVEYGRVTVRCATCGVVCVDREWGEREPPEVEKDQATLGQFT